MTITAEPKGRRKSGAPAADESSQDLVPARKGFVARRVDAGKAVVRAHTEAVVADARPQFLTVAQAAAVTGLIGSAGHQLATTPQAVNLTAMAAGALAAYPTAWYGLKKIIAGQMAGHPDSRIDRARRFVSMAASVTGGWLTSAAAFGVTPDTLGGKINLTAGAAIALWAASPYIRFRSERTVIPSPMPPRRPEPEQEPEQTPEPPAEFDIDLDLDDPANIPPLGWAVEVEKYCALWANSIGADKGALPGTHIDADTVTEIKGGWRATVASNVPGTVEPAKFASAVGRVAGAFRVGLTDLAIELDPSDSSQAFLTMLLDNPLVAVQHWAGPDGLIGDKQVPAFDLSSGIAIIGMYSDSELVKYRFWNAGGAWHDLIAGATGSGKSELTTLLLALERHAAVDVPVLNPDGTPQLSDDGTPVTVRKGLIVSRIIDPQWGQSFGDWQDHVDWFAPEITEARVLLQKTLAEMYARNRAMAKHTWYEQRGKKRIKRKGIKNFVATPDMPLISLTIDEAHEVLKDPVCKDIVARLGKMGRKCGIKLRLITQVPLLAELGNEMAIRDAVASGNVIVFRTANSYSGTAAFSGTLPAAPHLIPKEWPEGKAKAGEETTAGLGYVVGASSRAAIMRSFYSGDPINWIYDPEGEPWGAPGVLDELSRKAGNGYEDRWVRIDALYNMDEDERQAQETSPEGRRARGATCKDLVLYALLSVPDRGYKLKLDELTSRVPEFKARMVSEVVAKLKQDGWITSGSDAGAKYGFHKLTEQGVAEAQKYLAGRSEVVEDPGADEAREMVDA